MRLLSIIAISIAALTFSGCASFSPAPVNSPVLTLAKAEERASRLGLKITFPAGDYTPDFANERGIFYLAPGSVMFRNLGMSNPVRGGVFIPHPTTKEQNQLAWAQVSSATAIGTLLSSGASIYTYPVETPLSFSKKASNSEGPDSAPTAGTSAAEPSRMPTAVAAHL